MNQYTGPQARPTVRQFEILELVVRGYTNKQIGKELWVSEATVKTIISQMLEETGEPNRTSLAVKYALWLSVLGFGSESYPWTPEAYKTWDEWKKLKTRKNG